MFHARSFSFALFLLFTSLFALSGCGVTKKSMSRNPLGNQNNNVNNNNNNNNNGNNNGGGNGGSAAPTCQLLPFLPPGGAQLQPGVLTTVLVRVNGAATKLSVEVQGQSSLIHNFAYASTSLFTVNPQMTTTFIGKVEGPGGQSSCSATVIVLGQGSCQGAECYGSIVPLPVGIDPGVGFSDQDVVLTTIETQGACSIWRSNQVNPSYRWFKTAEYPILTAESEGIVLTAIDLRSLQFRSKHFLNVAVDLGPLKRLYPDSWQTKDVNFQICDNVPVPTPYGTMRTFRCLDKAGTHPSFPSNGPVLGLSKVVNDNRTDSSSWSMTKTYQAGQIPSTFLTSLWWNAFSVLPGQGVGADPNCHVRHSPLVMNFSRENIGFLGAGESVLFNLRNVGQPLPTSWLAPNARKYGFLTLDHNRNGKIDDGGELFGSHSLTPGGGRPSGEWPNGFEALAQYDIQGNGVITSADPVWPRLGVWFDENADGVSQAAELESLSSLNVKLIHTHYAEVERVDPETGNAIFQESSFQLNDGSIYPVYDVWFSEPRED